MKEMVDDVAAFRNAQRASGPATVMAIGTATPINCVDQSTYPDHYFRVTNSDDMTQLKDKFKRMCEKSQIMKRYLHVTENILKQNPSMCVRNAPSWNARRDILVEEIPKLGEKAARKAIKEWGQPVSNITHLIFCNTCGVDMPGPDFRLSKLLGLSPSVKRYMMYQQGCYGGGTVLRLAKDLAENNKGARVLVVCCEISSVAIITCPNETSLDNLLGQALFGDGAGAVIVGADPIIGVEKPLFQILSALQTIIPNSFGDIDGHVGEEAFIFHISKYVTEIVSNNLETCLKEALKPLSSISDWNSLFWILHPGGRAIVDKVEEKLNLGPKKLQATRHVLSEYGNMLGASVIFVMDEMRRKSVEQGFKTFGEGLKLGVLFGIGPGITVETVVLHSMLT